MLSWKLKISTTWLWKLLGSLLTHEMRLHEDEEQALKGNRRRGMTLKSKVIEESEDEYEKDNDEEMAMYARRFKRFMMKNKPWKKKNDQISKEGSPREYKKDFKKEYKKEKSIICNKHNKLRHVK